MFYLGNLSNANNTNVGTFPNTTIQYWRDYIIEVITDFRREW